VIPKPYSLEVLCLGVNTSGRDLIVGDIHGHFTKLAKALEAVGFDESVDRVISVGDLVDRGAESHLCLDWLAKPWFHAVRGNHEDMLCMYEDGDCDERMYQVNGGGWFISAGKSAREVFAKRLKQLPLAIEVETPTGLVAVVHADCPTPTWAQFKETLSHPEMGPRAAMACTWSRNRAQGMELGDVPDVRAVVVGHTPMERHTTMDNVHFIDTGAWLPAHYGNREFTILDAATLMRACKPLVETE
jgi:serine/threonine protein phosphatase 1